MKKLGLYYVDMDPIYRRSDKCNKNKWVYNTFLSNVRFGYKI